MIIHFVNINIINKRFVRLTLHMKNILFTIYFSIKTFIKSNAKCVIGKNREHEVNLKIKSPTYFFQNLKVDVLQNYFTKVFGRMMSKTFRISHSLGLIMCIYTLTTCLLTNKIDFNEWNSKLYAYDIVVNKSTSV